MNTLWTPKIGSRNQVLIEWRRILFRACRSFMRSKQWYMCVSLSTVQIKRGLKWRSWLWGGTTPWGAKMSSSFRNFVPILGFWCSSYWNTNQSIPISLQLFTTTNNTQIEGFLPCKKERDYIWHIETSFERRQFASHWRNEWKMFMKGYLFEKKGWKKDAKFRSKPPKIFTN